VLGAALIAGAYAIEPFDREPFTSGRDAFFVTAMVLGGASMIAGCIVGGVVAGEAEARDLDLVPIVALGGDQLLVGAAGRL
jgi:branched-subunit amino acid ABC-type transport system permease component